jgi:CcmD family protein
MDGSAHLPYLIAAYGVVWLGVLLYVTSLARRSRSLEREIDELRALLDKRRA